MFANFKYIQYVVGKSTQYAHNVPVRGVTDDNNTSKNSTFVQEDMEEKLDKVGKKKRKMEEVGDISNIDNLFHFKKNINK